MYLTYWGFREEPFGNVPSSRLFFPSPQHEEALFRLLFAVKHRKGAAMLTGEVGTGKTTVSRAFMERTAREHFDVKTIINPALDPVDFIRSILAKFGEESSGLDSKSVLLSRLNEKLLHNVDIGVNSVLVIDEAHVVENRAIFEEMRMLLNMQSDDQFLLTLILMGQSPLVDKIAAIQPLKERIAIRYHLDPFDLHNTVRYLLYRLKAAGAVRGIFTREAVEWLYEYSSGIPLRINSLCDRSLLIGMMQKSRVVNAKIMNLAHEDLA
jgi:general secretion pathway protein A